MIINPYEILKKHYVKKCKVIKINLVKISTKNLISRHSYLKLYPFRITSAYNCILHNPDFFMQFHEIHV